MNRYTSNYLDYPGDTYSQIDQKEAFRQQYERLLMQQQMQAAAYGAYGMQNARRQSVDTGPDKNLLLLEEQEQ